MTLYLIFGGIAALTTLSAGWSLYGAGRFSGLPYWCATALAAAIGLVVNFTLNHFLNFRFRHRPALTQFLTFCIIAGFGIVVASCLSAALLRILQDHVGSGLRLGSMTIPAKLAAHCIAVGLVALYSYPAHNVVSFNVGIRARLRQFRLHAAR